MGDNDKGNSVARRVAPGPVVAAGRRRREGVVSHGGSGPRSGREALLRPTFASLALARALDRRVGRAGLAARRSPGIPMRRRQDPTWTTSACAGTRCSSTTWSGRPGTTEVGALCTQHRTGRSAAATCTIGQLVHSWARPAAGPRCRSRARSPRPRADLRRRALHRRRMAAVAATTRCVAKHGGLESGDHGPALCRAMSPQRIMRPHLSLSVP